MTSGDLAADEGTYAPELTSTLRLLLPLHEAAQAVRLLKSGFDIFIAACAYQNYRLIRVVDPFAVFEKVLGHTQDAIQ